MPDDESNPVPTCSSSQSAIRQILQYLESIRASHKQVLQAWNHKKNKLDQCFQLRLFEQDCEKVIYILPDRCGNDSVGNYRFLN